MKNFNDEQKVRIIELLDYINTTFNRFNPIMIHVSIDDSLEYLPESLKLLMYLVKKKPVIEDVLIFVDNIVSNELKVKVDKKDINLFVAQIYKEFAKVFLV